MIKEVLFVCINFVIVSDFDYLHFVSFSLSPSFSSVHLLLVPVVTSPFPPSFPLTLSYPPSHPPSLPPFLSFSFSLTLPPILPSSLPPSLPPSSPSLSRAVPYSPQQRASSKHRIHFKQGNIL